MLHLICPLGTVATSVAMALAEPVGLTPIFYLLPMLLAGYFLPRGEIGCELRCSRCCAAAITLAPWVDPGLRLAMFMAVALIVGLVTGVVLALREQIRVLVTRLGELAIHDSLTGALNRGAFEQRLEAELARTDRMAAPCALVVLDVDHFKRINDTQGHAAGDAALRALALAVTRAKRRSDIFGRIGGEEFAVVLPDTGPRRAPRRSRRSCASRCRRRWATSRSASASPTPAPPGAPCAGCSTAPTSRSTTPSARAATAS